MNTPDTLLYTESHLWVNPFVKKIYTGFTECFPQVKTKFTKIELEQNHFYKKGEVCGIIHTRKGKENIIMPVSGTITAVNINVFLNPGMYNHDFYSGWMMSIAMKNSQELKGLMTASRYKKFTQTPAVK